MGVVAEAFKGPERRICHLPTRDIVDRIMLFAEEFSAVKLYTYQQLFCRRVIESVIENDGAEITGLWARQCGKTETIAICMVSMAIILPALANEFPDDTRLEPFLRGFRAGVYAPIKEQAGFAFGRMRLRVTSDHGNAFMSDPEIGVHLVVDRADTLEFSNGSFLIARSASPDTQVEGQTLHVVVCEEAQKLLRMKVEKELSPMLASTNGTMVKIGTAWQSRGGFHVSIQENIDRHRAGGKRNHYQFPYDIVIADKQRAFDRDGKASHLRYAKYVDKQRHKSGGEDTPEFRMNFKCEWQESRVIAVRHSIFNASAILDMEAGPRRWGFQVAGLDIGKINDSTCLTTMAVDINQPIRNPFHTASSDEEKQLYYKKTIIDWLELGGSFEGDAGQYRRLVEYLLRTNVTILVVDTTGIGDPVFERIEAMIGEDITCLPFKFSSASKSNLYKYYLQELHAGRIRYAAAPATRQRFEYGKFVQEHLELDKVEVGGYTVCQAPEGGHDDYPDSGALAAWAEKLMDEIEMPDIEVTSTPFGGGNSRRSYGGDMDDRGNEPQGFFGLTASNGGARGSRYTRSRR